jgi:hypothetical protein
MPEQKPVRVKLKDGTISEFPAGTTPERIKELLGQDIVPAGSAIASAPKESWWSKNEPMLPVEDIYRKYFEPKKPSNAWLSGVNEADIGAKRGVSHVTQELSRPKNLALLGGMGVATAAQPEAMAPFILNALFSAGMAGDAYSQATAPAPPNETTRDKWARGSSIGMDAIMAAAPWAIEGLRARGKPMAEGERGYLEGLIPESVARFFRNTPKEAMAPKYPANVPPKPPVSPQQALPLIVPSEMQPARAESVAPATPPISRSDPNLLINRPYVEPPPRVTLPPAAATEPQAQLSPQSDTLPPSLRQIIPQMPETGQTAMPLKGTVAEVPPSPFNPEVKVQSMIDQAVEARLSEYGDLFGSGLGKLSGKGKPIDKFGMNAEATANLKQGDTGFGRIRVKSAFPELGGVSARPGAIAEALARPGSKLYQQVREAATNWVNETFSDQIAAERQPPAEVPFDVGEPSPMGEPGEQGFARLTTGEKEKPGVPKVVKYNEARLGTPIRHPDLTEGTGAFITPDGRIIDIGSRAHIQALHEATGAQFKLDFATVGDWWHNTMRDTNLIRLANYDGQMVLEMHNKPTPAQLSEIRGLKDYWPRLRFLAEMWPTDSVANRRGSMDYSKMTESTSFPEFLGRVDDPATWSVALTKGNKWARPLDEPAANILKDLWNRGEEGYAVISDAEAPKKTTTAYKLFRTDEQGRLHPLFIDAKTEVPVGKWLRAEATKRSGFAFRPGWHSSDLPVATHIGKKSAPGLKAPDTRPANQVWAEVEVPADVDWQTEANRRGAGSKAQITDKIPEGGHYRYKTNPNMTGDWLISGAMKVKRVLSDAEVSKINRAAGVSDLPRRSSAGEEGFATVKDERQKDLFAPSAEPAHEEPKGPDAGAALINKVLQAKDSNVSKRDLLGLDKGKKKPSTAGKGFDFSPKLFSLLAPFLALIQGEQRKNE